MIFIVFKSDYEYILRNKLRDNINIHILLLTKRAGPKIFGPPVVL